MRCTAPLTQPHAHQSVRPTLAWHKWHHLTFNVYVHRTRSTAKRPPYLDPTSLPLSKCAGLAGRVVERDARLTLHRSVIQWAGSSTGRASECHCFSCGAFFLHVSVANDGQWRARAALIGARRGGGAARPALLAVLAMFVFRMQLFSKMSRWYTSSSYQHTTSLGNERPSQLYPPIPCTVDTHWTAVPII